MSPSFNLQFDDVDMQSSPMQSNVYHSHGHTEAMRQDSLDTYQRDVDAAIRSASQLSLSRKAMPLENDQLAVSSALFRDATGRYPPRSTQAELHQPARPKSRAKTPLDRTVSLSRMLMRSASSRDGTDDAVTLLKRALLPPVTESTVHLNSRVKSESAVETTKSLKSRMEQAVRRALSLPAQDRKLMVDRTVEVDALTMRRVHMRIVEGLIINGNNEI